MPKRLVDEPFLRARCTRRLLFLAASAFEGVASCLLGFRQRFVVAVTTDRKLCRAAATLCIRPSRLPVVVSFSTRGGRDHVGDSGNTTLWNVAPLAGCSFLFVLRQLRYQSVAMFASCLQSLGFSTERFVGKIFRLRLTSMSNSHVETVIFFLGLVDPSDAVV